MLRPEKKKQTNKLPQLKTQPRRQNPAEGKNSPCCKLSWRLEMCNPGKTLKIYATLALKSSQQWLNYPLRCQTNTLSHLTKPAYFWSSELDVFLIDPLDTKVSRESDVMMRSAAKKLSPHMEHDFSKGGRKNYNLSPANCEVKSISVALIYFNMDVYFGT